MRIADASHNFILHLLADKFHNDDKVSHRCNGLSVTGLKRKAFVVYIVIVSL